MSLIRCTKKLQKEMGLKASELQQGDPEPSVLGPWHANLIHIDRRKCIIFVNDKTLFNFITVDVSRAQIKDLGALFKKHFQCVVAEEELDLSVRQIILEEYSEFGYANTNSKSVLGSMNDLAFHYKYHILNAGGVHSYLVPSIIRRLNRMPMSALEYVFPIEALKSVYENAT